MGIKHLWTLLSPFCDRKPLYELEGKKVAVDLSCWICEAQNVADYNVQPRMYLRNLFFRTCYLLLMNVHPVFVLEGETPELKFNVIAARNAIQFKGARPKKDGVQKCDKGRTRFNFVLKQCSEMLNFMGVACVKGRGEAECMCAYLNEEGLVDGCVSQDSDCFAYGAKVIYRNFSISSQGAHAASGGSVDIYDITKAYEHLKFGRNKIVALALLLGSDYCEGVHGVGPDSAMKLLNSLEEEETLERLRSWRDKRSLFENFERILSDKNVCTSCGHAGKIQSHTRTGCRECRTEKGCDFSKYKDERLKIKNEVAIRSKALADPDFPNEELINEYLVRKDEMKELNLKWKHPDLVNFVKFASKYLQWEERSSFEKMLPILTRWQILHYEEIENQIKKDPSKMKGILYPDRIKKVRKPKGLLSYEIIWHDKDDYFKGLIPESQLENLTDLEKLWSTIEPQHAVEKAYPELVETYNKSKIKPKKAKVSKRKMKKDIDNISNLLQDTSISEPKKKVKKPRKKKIEDTHDLENSLKNLDINKKVNTIDNYFKRIGESTNQKSREAVMNENPNQLLRNQFNDNALSSSTPLKHRPSGASLDFDSFSVDVDNNNSDLDDIVDGIINRKRLSIIDTNLDNLGLKRFEIDEASIQVNDRLQEVAVTNTQNRSSFFITNTDTVEDDLFEKFLERSLSISDDDGDDENENTLEYNADMHAMQYNACSPEYEHCNEVSNLCLITQ